MKEPEKNLVIDENVLVIDKSMLEDMVKEKVYESLAKELPHSCFTCKWFRIKPDHVPHTKQCTCPEKIVVSKGECLMWELELDPNRRRRSLIE